MNPRYEFDVTVTRKDTLHAMQHAGDYFLRGPWRVLTIAQIAIVALFAPLGIIAFLWLTRDSTGLGFPSGQWMIFSIFLVAAWGCLALSRAQYARIAKGAVESAFNRNMRVTLSADGLTQRVGQTHWHTAWPEVEAIIDGRAVITLIVSGTALPLPKRAFADSSEVDEALARMRSWHAAGRS